MITHLDSSRCANKCLSRAPMEGTGDTAQMQSARGPVLWVSGHRSVGAGESTLTTHC